MQIMYALCSDRCILKNSNTVVKDRDKIHLHIFPLDINANTNAYVMTVYSMDQDSSITCYSKI
jgi:hypothetical protein